MNTNSAPTIFVHSSDNLSELASGEVNLLFESPPFERMHTCCGNAECLETYAGEAFATEFKRLLPERLRVLAKDGSFVLNFAAQIIDGFTSPAEYLLPHAVEEAGFRLVQTHHWLKPNAPPTAPGNRVKNCHEFLWHFAKGKNYYFNKDAVRQPHLYAGVDPRRDRYHEAGRDPGNAIWPLTDQINAVKEPDDNVIVLPKSQDQSRFGHGGKMREGLATRFIKLLSKPGDLVLDGFCGTGQTGVEALALDRRFVGYELHEERAQTARERLRINATSEPPPTPPEILLQSKIMNLKQCAQYIARTEGAVRMLVKKERIPFGRTEDGKIVFDKDAIDQWLQKSVTWIVPGNGPSQTQGAQAS